MGVWDVAVAILLLQMITVPIHVACMYRIIIECKRIRRLALTIWRLSGRRLR